MYVKTILLISWILLFSLHGCKEKGASIHNDPNENILKLSESETLKVVYLDSLSPLRSSMISLETNNILYMENRNTQSIDMYEWNSGKFLRRIKLNRSGPNGIGGGIRGFLVNQDSTFFIMSSQYRLSKMDYSGNILKSYPFNNLLTWPRIRTGNMAFFKEHNIISIHCTPDIPPYEKQMINLDVNIASGEYEVNTSFPEEYQNPKGEWGFYISNYRTLGSQGQIVHSFAAFPDIYVEKKQGDGYERYNAKSKYINEELIPYKSQEDAQQKRLFNKEYAHIIFDKYLKVYYRFCFIPEHSFQKPHESNMPNFSIMVLNNQFTKIFESSIYRGVDFMTYVHLVDEEGLWISRSNPDNINTKENELVFELFKLENLQFFK